MADPFAEPKVPTDVRSARHGFGPPRYQNIRFPQSNHLIGTHNRLKAGGAISLDGKRGDWERQFRHESNDTGDIRSIALLAHTTEDQLLNFFGIELCPFQ